jgi:rare lipoprotein A
MLKRNFLSLTLMATSLLLLNSCAKNDQDGAPSGYVNVSKIPNAKPRYLPKSRYGNPRSYVIKGKRYYVLKSATGYNKTGIASWYGTKFHGRLTSSREPYSLYAMTAASPVLPIPCFARVTNLSNGKQVIVKVNDRGPFAPNRIIDLSYVAAKKLGYMKQGTALVRVTTIDLSSPKPLHHIPGIYLQLGAFYDKHNASSLVTRAKGISNAPVHIVDKRKGWSTLYRVQVGPLKGVGESDKVLSAFKKAGYRKAFTFIE